MRFFKIRSARVEFLKVGVSVLSGTAVGSAIGASVWVYNEITRLAAENQQCVQRVSSLAPAVLGGTLVCVAGYLFLSRVYEQAIQREVEASSDTARERLALTRTSEAVAASAQSLSRRVDRCGLAFRITELIDQLPPEMEFPSDICCPISRTVMTDPVQTSEGISYERDSLRRWYLSGKSTCPINQTEALSDPDALPTNITLQNYIYDFLLRTVDDIKGTPAVLI